MSKVYLAGDLHLGHKYIGKYRDLGTSEEHDALITENVLSKSGKRNSLILLGDCFFTKESLDSLRLFRQYYGNIWFILGNHDCDSGERQDNIKTIIGENLVDKVYSLCKYKSHWLSHAPIHPDELRGFRNIHGHMHDKSIRDVYNYQCVSLEHTDYFPIEFGEVVGRFKVGCDDDDE